MDLRTRFPMKPGETYAREKSLPNSAAGRARTSPTSDRGGKDGWLWAKAGKLEKTTLKRAILEAQRGGIQVSSGQTAPNSPQQSQTPNNNSPRPQAPNNSPRP